MSGGIKMGIERTTVRQTEGVPYADEGTNQAVKVRNDPWEHRSTGMRCKTCMWFVPKKSGDNPVYDIGRCRRHAPTMNGYPVVFVNDWCGDHKLNENI